jgi:uncharacterized integral membrane protein
LTLLCRILWLEVVLAVVDDPSKRPCRDFGSPIERETVPDSADEPGVWTGQGNGAQRSDEQRRAMRKRIIAAVVAVVMIVFAILNFGRVKVNWIVATGHTPLIVVIVVSFGLGIAADRLAIERTRRRRRNET